MAAKYLVALYDVVLALGWFYILCQLVIGLSGPDRQAIIDDVRVARPDLIDIYVKLQVLMVLDIIFPMLGLIRSNLFIAAGQTIFRLIFALTTALIHQSEYPFFLIALLCFGIVESCRLAFGACCVLGN